MIFLLSVFYHFRHPCRLLNNPKTSKTCQEQCQSYIRNMCLFFSSKIDEGEYFNKEKDWYCIQILFF